MMGKSKELAQDKHTDWLALVTVSLCTLTMQDTTAQEKAHESLLKVCCTTFGPANVILGNIIW